MRRRLARMLRTRIDAGWRSTRAGLRGTPTRRIAGVSESQSNPTQAGTAISKKEERILHEHCFVTLQSCESLSRARRTSDVPVLVLLYGMFISNGPNVMPLNFITFTPSHKHYDPGSGGS